MDNEIFRIKMDAAINYDYAILSAPITDDFGDIVWVAVIQDYVRKSKKIMIHPEIDETRVKYYFEDLTIEGESEGEVVKKAYDTIASENEKYTPSEEDKVYQIIMKALVKDHGQDYNKCMFKVKDEHIQRVLNGEDVKKIAHELMYMKGEDNDSI